MNDKYNDDELLKAFRGRTHYFDVYKILSKLSGNLKILEVGAQDEVLKKFIPKGMSYETIDMYGTPDYKIDLNVENIPVEDNVYDVMICLETLEHTLYPKEIIKELKRVTKKDGLFILSMPNDYNFWLRIYYLFGMKSVCTDEPFEVVTKFQHIHKPRVKDILKFFSERFIILKTIPLWQSRSGTENNFFYKIDKIINFLAKRIPSLFSRLIIVVCKNLDSNLNDKELKNN